ncbi:MAG TPA: histone deacetylase family protein [Bacteroides sp.]|nr:histone deacetylase family protein [Bacteroides sp.]
MIIIRRIHDATLPSDRNAIAQVQEILRNRFPDVREKYVENIPEQLTDPLKYRFRTSLLVSENRNGVVRGFSLMYHAPDLHFCFLDFIATRREVKTGGIGSSLYESAREEAIRLKSSGLFFECLPDDPALCKNEALMEENRARLKFYERFGAFPLINTRYETPVNPEKDDCPPYLVCDFLGQPPVGKKAARKIVRAILERKYEDLVTEDYIQDVVRSIGDDPVRLREPRYTRPRKSPSAPAPGQPGSGSILLAINDRHSIHHVRDRGYVESPVRISTIAAELNPSGLFRELPVRTFSEKHIQAVHDAGYIRYFKRVCASLPAGKSIYPYVFPVRNKHRAPSDDSVLAGYYCIDTFTPLNRNAYLAAKRAVDCALTCAVQLLGGGRAAYALVRPPGHHAEKKVFGGFCYFNSAAIAAHYLSHYGKVAMLDVDYHHGNGQQDIFYHRKDVLTISIHGHPSFAYPYFSGYAEEKGEGEGLGYNVNYPLKEQLSGGEYRTVLEKAMERIRRFRPDYLVVPLGLDPSKGDPTGTWSLSASDFSQNGMIIGKYRFPTLFVQEGGYKNRVLGVNARHFFQGFHTAFFNDYKR